MTAVPPPQQQQQPGAAPQPGQAPQPQAGQTPGAPPPAAPAAGGGGLPPTGLQAQMTSLNQFYQQAAGQGVTPGSTQPAQALQGGGVSGGAMAPGQMNIQQMAQQMAQRYGLPMGRGELVDPSGNFQVTPDQLAASSGESQGMIAAKMGYISQAIANEQNRQQQQKGIAAIETGMGLVQSRGRGSLAAMQSGFYQDIADLYSNQESEAADFSFFVEEERFQMQMQLQRKAEERAKKSARFGTILGIAGVAMAPFTGGASLGLAGGLSQAGETGWF